MTSVNSKTKIFFASDFHLGVPDDNSSLQREKAIVQWIDNIKSSAQAIYLVGDIFDFWFEYKHVVPKGYTRLFGKLAEITDMGIPIYLIVGNHDQWTFGYLQKELGITVIKNNQKLELQGKKIFLSHGDAIGPGDYGYKFIKWLFSNRIAQWLFARFHPNFGVGIALFFSRRSRAANVIKDNVFLGPEKERHIIFARKLINQEHFDYIIMGHRHLPMIHQLNEKSQYINLGDWVVHQSYAILEDGKISLHDFKQEQNLQNI